MLHTKFNGNRPPVQEKKIFEGYLPYMGVVAMSSDFHFLVPRSFIQNLVLIGTVVSEKIQFKFLYVHDLGPRSRNDLDLQYSHIFIIIFNKMSAATNFQVTGFNSFLKNPLFSFFPIEKPMLPNLTLP